MVCALSLNHWFGAMNVPQEAAEWFAPPFASPIDYYRLYVRAHQWRIQGEAKGPCPTSIQIQKKKIIFMKKGWILGRKCSLPSFKKIFFFNLEPPPLWPTTGSPTGTHSLKPAYNSKIFKFLIKVLDLNWKFSLSKEEEKGQIYNIGVW